MKERDVARRMHGPILPRLSFCCHTRRRSAEALCLLHALACKSLPGVRAAIFLLDCYFVMQSTGLLCPVLSFLTVRTRHIRTSCGLATCVYR